MLLVVAYHVLLRISYVNSGLENLNPLFGKLGTSHAAYQFFCLARKHRAAHNFNSTRAVRFACCWICNHGAKIRFFMKLKKLKELKGVKG
jgi:hypothetical protein